MQQPPIVNVYELAEPMDRVRAPNYGSKHYALAAKLGLKKLGFNVTELAPGTRSFPYHFHHANEELFLVLEGEGKLRWPGGESPLERGDLVGCVTGADGAHQIVNTGSGPLRYLALSTTQDPEVVEYPDSQKFAAIAGRPPGTPLAGAKFLHVGYPKDRVDYWAGEE